MSHWDSTQQKVIRWQPEPYPDYPGWLLIDCGCSGGLEWGGDYPHEHKRCGGNGQLALHEKSGVLALYPGGPFSGSAA